MSVTEKNQAQLLTTINRCNEQIEYFLSIGNLKHVKTWDDLKQKHVKELYKF